MSMSSKKHAIEDYRAKRAELEQISKRDRAETEEYHAANKAVADAEKRVPFWRR